MLRRGCVPSRGGASGRGRDAASTSPSPDRSTPLYIENLTNLVKTLQEKLDKQSQDIDEAVERKLEEERSKVQHQVATQINKNLDILDQNKKEEKFKYKASASAIARIVEIRSKAREAVAEGERDFEDFGETKTGEALQEILDILERQEGFIRLAESSKHGYRLVDKLQEKAKTYPHFSDPDLVKRIQEAEKDLDKEDEKVKKSARRRSRSRSGSRTRSRSRTRKAKKGSSPSRKGYGFSCYWCGRPGHS